MIRSSAIRQGLFGAAAALAVLAIPTHVDAQAAAARPAAAAAKPALPIDDYDRWRTIGSVELSSDGGWVTYAYGHRVVEDTLVVEPLEEGETWRIPRATRPAFSDDGRWLAYRIDAAGATGAGSMVGLLELATGAHREWALADGFEFSPGASHLLIRKTSETGETEEEGRDVLLRDLRSGRDLRLSYVDEAAFDPRGTMLAYTVSAPDRDGNGLYILDLANGAIRTVDQDRLRYARLTWDETGRALAALRGTEVEGMTERANEVVAIPDLSREGGVVRLAAAEIGVPEGYVISERGALSWRSDRDVVFIGIKEQRPVVLDDPERPRPDVDVFHWNDREIQTVQRQRAEADRSFTFRGAVDLDASRYVPLTDAEMRTIVLTPDGRRGVGRDDRAYVSDWEEDRADYYAVDTSTGARTPIVTEQRRTLGISPDGRRFAYWRDGDVLVYSFADGESRNLTAAAPVSFVDETFDRPGTKPPYGVEGWTADGRGLVLAHRYDLWRVPLDGGTATNLTGGRGDRDEIRFRVERRRGEEAIDLSRPVVLSAYGEWTKRSGWFHLANGRLEELVYGDRLYDDLLRADDRWLFTSSTFADPPDLYVAEGGPRAARRLTEANPQAAEYAWGHRILFDFENADGVRLQGTLAIPDSYREGERLPMIVNFYERKSQELHFYYAPLFESGYPSGNPGPVSEIGAWVSNGYLVMQPDIHFNTGTTHSDMLDCVTAAVRRVIEMGYADPDRIALVGGSFSGGGSAFIATQTDMFAAVVSRAAPINLAGEFNILFSGSGQNNHSYDIYGQGRYGTNPFDDFELYRQQSPITHVESMNTPLLYLHGKEDGSVEYLQGMEFYNALRFLGKPIIFLSYENEGHNLRRYENQRDFVERQWQFLDHYLKGAPAPRWMTDGVPFLDRAYGPNGYVPER